MAEKVALVTGAAKRVGRDIAVRLARAGYALALHCNASVREAGELAASIAAEGATVQTFSADLADPAQAGALVPRVQSALGPLALLVNNASLFLSDTALRTDPEVWRRQFAVNLEAPLLLAQALAQSLPQGAPGAIVNIIDQRVLRLTPQHFSYTLTKSALWTATQTMAQAFAPRIRVNAVGPGPTYPSWSEGERGIGVESGNVPLRRRVSGDEIADAVLYLARAESVTGALICVDAGQHLAWRTPDIVE